MTQIPIAVALNISCLTVIAFCIHLLLLRTSQQQAHLPLAVFLLSLAVIICQPSLTVFAPGLKIYALIIALPALLMIGPCLWFYVKGITSDTPWQWRKESHRHFLFFYAGAMIALLALIAPEDIKYALLVEGDDGYLASVSGGWKYISYVAVFGAFVLVMSWIGQSAFYVVKILRRLGHYRHQLKHVFASTETRELRWLTWLLIAVGGVWCAAVINLILDNLFFTTDFDAIAIQAILLLMAWSICLWGLRQKPGFEELYGEKSNNLEGTLATADNEAANTSPKYQRSALDKDMAEKIADRIKQAMQSEHLYLDASLSLPKLAKHIHTPANYISQTLNETLGCNFFDFVNQYRIEASMQRLSSSSDAIIDIAMDVGFNAKSSFYTAFKKHTRQTPSQYRKLSQG